jgi:hypothetical protein
VLTSLPAFEKLTTPEDPVNASLSRIAEADWLTRLPLGISTVSELDGPEIAPSTTAGSVAAPLINIFESDANVISPDE